MSERKIITVDGLAGSGKSTLARLLAEKLHYVHLNSGLLYRAIGYLALQEKIDPGDEAQLKRILPQHQVLLDGNAESTGIVRLDGKDITKLIQRPEVSEATSLASQFPIVRQRLLELQRQAFPGKPMVAEGRDMGTVVFPEAPLKFFISADEKVRVTRRLAQLMEHATDKSEHARQALSRTIRIEIAERDRRDSGRALAPTCAAADAVLIDNSSDPLEKVLEAMVCAARSRGL